MEFLNPPPGAPPGFNAFNPNARSDGQGGSYLQGILLLRITDATGVYEPFIGGANCMVDTLHQLADGQLNEFCFCNISRYPFP
jgi:hypothetical protein